MYGSIRSRGRREGVLLVHRPHQIGVVSRRPSVSARNGSRTASGLWG